MKKFILLAAVCLLAVSCGTPRLALNTTDKGHHIALTSNSKLFRFNDNNMFAALGARTAQKDTVIAILITYDGDTGSGIFDRNDKLKVRLTDGTEFELSNFYDKEYEDHTETQTSERAVTDWAPAYSYSPWTGYMYFDPITVTRWVPQVYTTKITNSYGLYPITASQLMGILEKGVIKLRIESALGDADMTNPEYAKEIFQDQFDVLVQAFAKNVSTDF